MIDPRKLVSVQYSGRNMYFIQQSLYGGNNFLIIHSENKITEENVLAVVKERLPEEIIQEDVYDIMDIIEEKKLKCVICEYFEISISWLLHSDYDMEELRTYFNNCILNEEMPSFVCCHCFVKLERYELDV